MKVFTISTLIGIWPVPTTAVIVAPHKDLAFVLLMRKLGDKVGNYSNDEKKRIRESLIELDTSAAHAVILSVGDY